MFEVVFDACLQQEEKTENDRSHRSHAEHGERILDETDECVRKTGNNYWTRTITLAQTLFFARDTFARTFLVL